MENNKQTKSNGTTVLIVLLLLITIVAVILATYAWAKYTETFDNQEATATVAKWNVSASKGETMFSKTFNHVSPERMAPGTDGSFEATIDVAGTEVDVDYTVTLVSVEATVEKEEDGEKVETSVPVPQNLILRDNEGEIIYQNKAIVGEGIIGTGRIPAGSTGDAAKETKLLKWEWPWETIGKDDDETAANNAQDTEDGRNAGTLKVTYKIDAVQVHPTEQTESNPDESSENP